MKSNRRNFLQQALLLAGATTLPLGLLTSCTNEDAMEAATGRYRHEPFTTLALLRAAIRKSGGHYPARLAELGKAKDWRGAYRLLHESFLTLPSKSSKGWTVGCGSGTNAFRHGTHAAARAGAGTLLEQTLLLQETLTTAGLTTQLMQHRRELTEQAILDHLYQPRDRQEEMELPSGLRQRLDKTFTKEAPTSPDQPAIEALASRIETGLGDAAQPVAQEIASGITDLPVLVVTDPVDGATYALDLFTGAEPEPAEPLLKDRSFKAFALPARTPEVPVRLRARFHGSKKDVTLLEHDFPVADVLGRHVEVAFAPAVPLKLAMNLHPRSLTAFTPIMRVARLDTDPLVRADEPPITGDPFTVFNEEVTANRGRIVRADQRFSQPADPDRAATVASVKLEANGYGYPDIVVKARLLDADGKAVNGLQTADLQLEENGQPVLFTMQSHEPKARVLILLDETTSLPEAYRTPEFQAGFERNITQLVRKKLPNASVQMIKGRDTFYGWLADIADKPAEAIPNLIVCFSDGLIIDKFKPEYEAKYAALPPLIFSYVGDTIHPDLDTLAGHLDVTPVNIADEVGLREEINRKLSDDAILPYILRYVSGRPGETQAGEKAPISLKVGGTVGKGEYTIGAGALRPRLAGLYLDLGQYGYERFVVAGYDKGMDEEITAEHMNACHDALFSRNAIYLEGGGPTLPVMLDDLYASYLSRYPTIEALENQTEDDLLDQAIGQQVVKDALALSLVGELAGAAGTDHLTFADGYRCCVSQTRMDLTEAVSIQRLSLVPTAQTTTLATSPMAGFRQTLRHSLQLADMERRAYPTSTWSVLGDDRLVSLNELTPDESSPPEWDKLAFNRLKNVVRTHVPKGFTTLHSTRVRAPYFYIVDRKTGEAIGLLPDGTGGAQKKSDPGKGATERFARIANVWAALVTTMGVGSLSLGAVGAYFVMLAQLYAEAATQITGMESDPCKFRQIVLSGVVNMTIGNIIGATGKAGDVVTYANLIPGLVPDWGKAMEGYCAAGQQKGG